MSELRTNRIVPRDGLVSGASGGIIQVVHGSTQTATAQNFNTDSFLDTGLTASITPTRSDSKILVTGYVSWYVALGGNGSAEWNFAVCDGSNNILDGTTALAGGYRFNELYAQAGKHPINFLHSPSTTSAFTYKIRMNAKNANQSGNVNCQKDNQANNISRITLMEVSG